MERRRKECGVCLPVARPYSWNDKKRKESMQIDATENAPVSETALDHGQKLEGYLRDIAKPKANTMEVKRMEIQPLVEALSEMATGVRTNAATEQVARDREAETSALYEPIISPD